jgi:hypothetical protein
MDVRRLDGPTVTPSCFGIRDARSGPRRHSLEVLPSASRRGVPNVVDSVVVAELAPRLVRH